jgi:HPt (histidine-containing phosphotransfer) domain-containing protein
VRVRDIRAAIENGKLDAARATSHALRGSAGQLGAHELAEAARQIEYCPPEEEPREMEPRMRTLVTLAASTLEVLTAWPARA